MTSELLKLVGLFCFTPLPLSKLIPDVTVAGLREHTDFFISKGGYTNPSSMFRVDLKQPEGHMVKLYRTTKLDGINADDYETTQEFYEYVEVDFSQETRQG